MNYIDQWMTYKAPTTEETAIHRQLRNLEVTVEEGIKGIPDFHAPTVFQSWEEVVVQYARFIGANVPRGAHRQRAIEALELVRNAGNEIILEMRRVLPKTAHGWDRSARETSLGALMSTNSEGLILRTRLREARYLASAAVACEHRVTPPDAL